MEERKLTCIGCPMGCPLTVVMNGKEVVGVTGNTCKRGSDYAAKEVTHPTRIVTSTVCVRGGSIPMVSVKIAQDIPKEKIFEIMKYINGSGTHRRCPAERYCRNRRRPDRHQRSSLLEPQMQLQK